jgi:hypothetical protein
MPGLQLLYGAEPVVFRRALGTAPALPELIGECGDVVLVGFVDEAGGAMPGAGLPVPLLCEQVGVVGVLEAVPGGFMPGQVILFSVVLGAGAVGVSSKVTVFRSYLL